MNLSTVFLTVVLSVFLSGCVSTYDSQIQKLSQAYVAGEISKADYRAGFAAIQRKKAKQQEMLKALGEGLQGFGEGYQQAYDSTPNYNSQAYNNYVKNYSSTVSQPKAPSLYPPKRAQQNTSLFYKDVHMKNSEDYRRGFREGYLSIKGNASYTDSIPYPSSAGNIIAGDTYFRKGIRDGIAQARTGF
jgi:hypothetical protein